MESSGQVAKVEGKALRGALSTSKMATQPGSSQRRRKDASKEVCFPVWRCPDSAQLRAPSLLTQEITMACQEVTRDEKCRKLGEELGHFVAQLMPAGVPAGLQVPAGVTVRVHPAGMLSFGHPSRALLCKSRSPIEWRLKGKREASVLQTRSQARQEAPAPASGAPVCAYNSPPSFTQVDVLSPSLAPGQAGVSQASPALSLQEPGAISQAAQREWSSFHAPRRCSQAATQAHMDAASGGRQLRHQPAHRPEACAPPEQATCGCRECSALGVLSRRALYFLKWKWLAFKFRVVL